ncbi:UNVERIFIED_CONTAM: hypothetical protein RMT77_013745 [Armadillidium vulgare]
MKVETSDDISVLFLSNLGPESSGNYSCVPSNAKPSTIHIQILRGGEIPAAIHSSAPRLVMFCEENSKSFFVIPLLVLVSSILDFNTLFDILSLYTMGVLQSIKLFILFKSFYYSS